MQSIETQALVGAIVSFVVVGIMFAFFLILVFIYQKKRRQKEQELFESIISTEEKERIRIAKELHDSVGASLSAVKLHFGAIMPGIENVEKAERIAKMLSDACDEVRIISHQMMPKAIQSEGFFKALDLFLHPFKQLEQVNVEYILLGEPREIVDQSKSVMLFRVIQELVNNALKHASAANITIQITVQPETLLVLVEDDGIGFDSNLETQNYGLGLSNIRNRVNYLKGNLNIESEPGKGTTVLIHLNI